MDCNKASRPPSAPLCVISLSLTGFVDFKGGGGAAGATGAGGAGGADATETAGGKGLLTDVPLITSST